MKTTFQNMNIGSNDLLDSNERTRDVNKRKDKNANIKSNGE